MILAEPRPDARQLLGRRGEAAAERVLEAAGLRILDRRYRRRAGEIDIVAEQGAVLVFVEVKTRRGLSFGGPAAAVTRQKQRRMARVALGYMQCRGWLDRPARFDVVEVLAVRGSDLSVHHIEDAFRIWPTG